MSDFNRGIMKFNDADSPVVIFISSLLILSSIAALVWWGFQSAYV
ncbi:MAG: hypothetical protein WCO45_11365 [Pseudanabaena sp. ELA607]